MRALNLSILLIEVFCFVFFLIQEIIHLPLYLGGGDFKFQL